MDSIWPLLAFYGFGLIVLPLLLRWGFRQWTTYRSKRVFEREVATLMKPSPYSAKIAAVLSEERAVMRARQLL